MFASNSRYAKAGTYTIREPGGAEVAVSRLPVRTPPQILGHHPRTEGQRLDAIAAHYLADATAFWKLCDAGNAMAPDAMAAGERVPIPRNEG